jgi:hypothetical protein
MFVSLLLLLVIFLLGRIDLGNPTADQSYGFLVDEFRAERWHLQKRITGRHALHQCASIWILGLDAKRRLGR